MLTKTDFLEYLNCPKHLWAIKNNPEAILQERTLSDDFTIQQGYDIERLAYELFPHGTSMKEKDDLQAALETQEAIRSKGTIYQATFISGEFLVRVDILKYNEESKNWDIFEVKSGTKEKKEHIYDLCFQKIVCSEAGLPLGTLFLVHVNKEYIRNGEINVHQFFQTEDVTDQITGIEGTVTIQMQDAINVITNLNCKQYEACYKPDECICPSICHPDLPEYSIYHIARIHKSKLERLREDGILSIYDVPEGFEISDNQSFQVEIAKKGLPYIDRKSIQKEFDKLQYPLYFLDYETIPYAVPFFDSFKPYQHVPFQYSLHILEEPGKDIKHCEFLHTNNSNSIPDFVSAMMSHLPERGGSVIVWNKHFEAGRNKDISIMHHEYANYMASVNERMFDLLDIFREGFYIHPDFKGSASIKTVLPVLVPDLRYDDLTIKEGSMAYVNWYKMVFGNIPLEEREKIACHLLEYCKLDTLAMLKIFEVLNKL